MPSKETLEHFEHLEEEIDELCKDVDMNKVYDEICNENEELKNEILDIFKKVSIKFFGEVGVVS